MNDKGDVHSTSASSDISASLRDQILGKSSGNRRSHSGAENAKHSNKVLPAEPRRATVDKKTSTALGNINDSADRCMKNLGVIKTQTVAIQTGISGADGELHCTYSRECDCCRCKKCKSRKCHPDVNVQRLAVSGTTSDDSIFGRCAESSSQTVEPCRCRRTCNCRRYWDRCHHSSDVSACSDDSFTTDFFNLPYQNNEEYLRMLRELEKKLLARNRDRVRKTMMEFERRSRLNQNLDKPICDYGGESRSKAKYKNLRGSVCCKCGRNKRINSDILQNERRWDAMDLGKCAMKKIDETRPPTCNNMQKCCRKSHWQLDPRSGEWIKVNCQQGDFLKATSPCDYRNEKRVPSPLCFKKECYCKQRTRH